MTGVKNSTQVLQDQGFGDFEISPKVSKSEIKEKVLEILDKPIKVNTQELVQKASYGNKNPLLTFDIEKFRSKIK